MSDVAEVAEKTYRRYLPDLAAWAGWYVLIRGDRLGGVFPTIEAAARAGELLYPSIAVFIRKIERTAGGSGPGIVLHA